VAELVDALDLGSSAARRGGSSPFTRTFIKFIKFTQVDIKLDREENGLDALLTLNIKLEDIEEGAMKKIKSQKQNLNIPGFRKGHVPTGIAKKYLWESVLKEELEKKLETEIDKYFKDNNIDIIRPVLPVIEDKKIDLKEDKEFEFKYNIGIVDEYELKYEELFKEIKKYKISISKENIDKEVELIRDAYGEHSHPDTIEDDENLKVYFDIFELDENKNKLEDGINQKVNKNLSELPKEVKEKILGAKTDEEIEISISEIFGAKEDFATFLDIEKLAAEDANDFFKIKVLSIHKHVKAEIDDQLFEKFGQGQVKSEEEFYQKVEELLEKSNERNSNNYLNEDISRKIIDGAGINLPDKYLDLLFEEEYADRKKEMDEEQLSSERKEYDKKIIWNLISNKIAVENNIEATEEEIVNETYNFIGNYYMQYGMQIQGEQLENQVREYLKTPQNIMFIKENIINNKVLTYLRENNEFMEEEIDHESFKKLNDKNQNQ
jgi:trigger factor